MAEVYVVMGEDRHSGPYVTGVYADLDDALSAADAVLDEYGVGVGDLDTYRGSGETVAGVQWGDGNMIQVERTTFYQGEVPSSVPELSAS